MHLSHETSRIQRDILRIYSNYEAYLGLYDGQHVENLTAHKRTLCVICSWGYITRPKQNFDVDTLQDVFMLLLADSKVVYVQQPCE